METGEREGDGGGNWGKGEVLLWEVGRGRGMTVGTGEREGDDHGKWGQGGRWSWLMGRGREMVVGSGGREEYGPENWERGRDSAGELGEREDPGAGTALGCRQRDKQSALTPMCCAPPTPTWGHHLSTPSSVHRSPPTLHPPIPPWLTAAFRHGRYFLGRTLGACAASRALPAPSQNRPPRNAPCWGGGGPDVSQSWGG